MRGGAGARSVVAAHCAGRPSNSIEAIPEEIGRMASLVDLQLANCRLASVPSALQGPPPWCTHSEEAERFPGRRSCADCSALEQVDLAGNVISTLGVDFGEMNERRRTRAPSFHSLQAACPGFAT